MVACRERQPAHLARDITCGRQRPRRFAHGGRSRLWVSHWWATATGPTWPRYARIYRVKRLCQPTAAKWRGHWGIENRVHWVRDVTFDEDRSQVRTGSAPQIMAALRNLTISVIRLAGETNIAAALRRHAVHPSRPLALIGALPIIERPWHEGAAL